MMTPRILTALLGTLYLWPAVGSATVRYIDVLLAVDAKAAAYLQNEKGLTADAYAASQVAGMNAVLTNSGLSSKFQFRSAGAYELGFEAVRIDSSKALTRDVLENATGGKGIWEDLHTERDNRGADVVSVIIDTGSEYGHVGDGNALTDLNAAATFGESAYSVVGVRSTFEYYAVLHEIAHNLGCGHAAEVGEGGNHPTGAAYGYYFAGGDSKNYYTVMGYPKNGHTAAAVFSSPDVQYAGVAAGTAQKDNVSVLEATYEAASEWRSLPTKAHPLMSVAWNQQSPMNDFAAVAYKNGSWQKAPCGCPATAAAQMLKHYGWPMRTDDVFEGATQRYRDDAPEAFPIRFDGHNDFRWEKMQNRASDNDVIGAFETARLAMWCGAMALTDYRVGDSSADFENVAESASPWFKKGRSTFYSSDGADATLKALTNALDRGELVQVMLKGHQVVADAYRLNQGNLEVHLNYGWAGTQTGWYAKAQLEDAYAGIVNVWTGFTPKKMAQLKPLPKQVTGSVPLSWSVPQKHADDLTGFMLMCYYPGDTLQNAYAGSAGTMAADRAGTYSLTGAFGLTANSTISYALNSYHTTGIEVELQARLDAGEWETIATPALSTAEDVYDKGTLVSAGWLETAEEVDLGRFAGKTAEFRFKVTRTAKTRTKDGQLFFAKPVWTQVYPPTSQTLGLQGYKSLRSYPLPATGYAGKVVSFTIEPLLADSVVSEPVATKVVATSVPAQPAVVSVDGLSPDAPDGIRRTCGIGKSTFAVKVNETTTGLSASSSHLALVGDDDIACTKLDAMTWSVTVDATGVPDGSQLILTLAASDALGNKAYKDLQLAFKEGGGVPSDPESAYDAVALATFYGFDTLTNGGYTATFNGGAYRFARDTTWSGNDDGLSVLVRYSGYAQPTADANLVTLKSSAVGSGTDNGAGVFARASDGTVHGVWGNSAWTGSDTDKSKVQVCDRTVAAEGYLVLTYKGNVGSVLYDGAGSVIYQSSALMTRNAQQVGGLVTVGSANATMTVEGVRIFKGVLAQDEIAAAVEDFEQGLAEPETLSEMYHNRLSSVNATIPGGWYGAIAVPAVGFMATAFDAATALSNTASGDEIGGSAASIITKEGDDWDLCEHTVTGWFKVDALPAAEGGANAKTIYVAKNGNGSYGGYKVAVDSVGKILVGQCDNEAWRAAKVVTETAQVAPGAWFHLAVAVRGRTDGNRDSAVSIFVNGRAVAVTDAKIKTNLNGGSATLYIGGKGVTSGLGISAAGIYVDNAVLTNALTIISLARSCVAEVPTVRPEITKDASTHTWTVDTTDIAYEFSSSEIAELKSTAWKVTLRSSSAFGATVGFGSVSAAQASHFVIESGTHAMTWINGTANINFTTDGTDADPSILVKDGATLNLTAKDLTGWQGSAASKGGNLIRVNGGGTLNLLQSGTSTYFYQGRLWLDPGATVAADFTLNQFRLNGGAAANSEQLYVPDSAAESQAATLTSVHGLRLAKDTTGGLGVSVGANSTLVIDADVTSDGAQPLMKNGAGTLAIDGALTGFTGAFTVNAGTLGLTQPTLGGPLVMAAGTTLAVTYGGAVCHGTAVLTATSLAVGDNVTLLVNGVEEIYSVQGGSIVIEQAAAEVGGVKYGTLAEAVAAAGNGGTIKLLVEKTTAIDDELAALAVTAEPLAGEVATYTVAFTMAEGPSLRFSEIMPKPSDKPYDITTQAGYDRNGLESGWVEVENTGDTWVDLGDYKFCRANRGKVYTHADYGNFPTNVLIAPHGRYTFYTSERYANSATPEESAFATPVDAKRPHYFAEYGMMVWPDKVNPKKFPYVTLVYRPQSAAKDTVIETVIVPNDTPEGYSIIVGHDETDAEATKRWLCPTPTFNAENASTASLVKIGPNAGPAYGTKHSVSEFVATAPAKPGVPYTVRLNVNPVYRAAGARAADAIAGVTLVYRRDLNDATRGEVAMTRDGADKGGDVWTADIPSEALPAAGHLLQWKTKIADVAGNEWTSPSFMNKDDGYEWYGTIVEPGADLLAERLATWHMFADSQSLGQMNVDAAKQTMANNARVAIYDSSTSNYYDYVRIDLRGNTSAHFTKKSHGLRFSKVNPMTMYDPVRKTTWKEIRKTSLIGEPADPSRMRQLTSFWLWNEMGNNVPFDFPVRCNMNGAFFEVGFNSERFTDELIEDVYGLDKYGYSYKNVGTLAPGSGTTAGGIEKKTPDDGNESDVSKLESELRQKIKAASTANDDNAALTRVVVERFDLPAWLNYLASARITQEMDDVWANISMYWDDAQMLEGARGTATWMPLGYDFNLSLGQWYFGDARSVGRPTVMSNQDWFKSHPFYGGMKVRSHGSPTDATTGPGNYGIESVLQSSKFRRLFLRRMRTLMDAYLGAPDANETFESTTNPIIVKMKEVASLMGRDGDLDRTTYPWDTSIDANDVWGQANFPATVTAGIEDIYTNYIVPRRMHLYVTHAATNTAKTVGYGSTLNAGIPEAQPAASELKAKIGLVSFDGDAVVITNGNDIAVDMSGWTFKYGVDYTLPAGTVVDATDCLYVVRDRRAYVAALGEGVTDQVIVGNATFGESLEAIALSADDGTEIIFEVPATAEKESLRLAAFYGNTLGDGDTGEWFELTNISATATLDLSDVTVCFLKKDDPESAGHCHVTFTKGSINPCASKRFEMDDYAGKGWEKIQNNKQVITISDKYGVTCQQLKVTQKDYYFAYGRGGYLVCDSTAASVKDDPKNWHVVYNVESASEETALEAKTLEEAQKIAASASVTLTDDDKAAGLTEEALMLMVFAETNDLGAVSYRMGIEVNPEKVLPPAVGAVVEGGESVEPLTFEEETEDGRAVSIGINNAVKGLWYGYETADVLGSDFVNDVPSFKRAGGDTVKITGSPRKATSGFFRVKVLPAKPTK